MCRCLHPFWTRKSISPSWIPLPAKKTEEPHTWSSKPSWCLQSGWMGRRWKAAGSPCWRWRCTGSWLDYHIKALTIPVIILGQSGFSTFSIKTFKPLCSPAASGMSLDPWSALLWLGKTPSFGHSSMWLSCGICQSETLIYFYLKKDTVYNNNLFWNHSIYHTKWTRMSPGKKRKHKKLLLVN